MNVYRLSTASRTDNCDFTRLDNRNNGNITYDVSSNVQEHITNTEQLNNSNNNALPEDITKFTSDLSNVDTSELILLDNATKNIIKLEDFKKVDVFSTVESNFNCSANSLISDNLSSPMQTSTDVYVDSEILSTDMASNDSHSPKNLKQSEAAHYDQNQDIERISEFPEKSLSVESLSQVKSDKSLLNSEESDCGSPVHKTNRNYKKQKKVRKKYFGVKTLQSIFNRYDGYSDVSTTASELGEDIAVPSVSHCIPSNVELPRPPPITVSAPTKPTNNQKPPPKVVCADTSSHFEEQVHSIISDILTKSHINPTPLLKTTKHSLVPSKKHFSLNGQNLRVGKALRLCPNDEAMESYSQDQKKEKLLARYVYNANFLNVDGVGDPDFGTPV